MEDISTILAERFAAGFSQQEQPVSEMINARLQRIQELERVRQEHLSEHSPSTPSGDAASRHSRRDRFIRQSSQRSSERRGASSSIQRTPVRSQSFENTSTVSHIDEDTINFREMFENARQSIFGPRASGSNESLNGARTSDSAVTMARPVFQTGSDSGSGSSTPRTSIPQFDVTAGLAEAFSNLRSSLRRSDSSGALGEPRRSSITHETNSTPNIQRLAVSNANGSSAARSSSARESRRESRFRRRTIQGVETNISRALEQERYQRTLPSASRALSPLVMESVSASSSSTIRESTSLTQRREISHTSSFNSSSSLNISRAPRKIELHSEDGIPNLGFENDQVVFIDNSGKCYWLNKSHALIRALKNSKKLPEIITKPKLAITSREDTDGYIAMMEGDDEARYTKLRELVMLARRRDANFENGDCTDSIKSLSLLELYQRGDFIEEPDDNDIDKKYKSYSLYTKPRPRPDMETFFEGKVVPSLYDGIPRSNLPQEIIDLERTASETEQNTGAVGSFAERSSFSASENTDRFEANGTVTVSEQRRSEASHEQILNNSVDGVSASVARSEAMQEALETNTDSFGNEDLRFNRLHARSEQAELRYDDGASAALLRRAEARRQQYLESRGSSENGGTVLQRRAEERRQQYLEEHHTGENGSSVRHTRAENIQQQFSSESRTDQTGRTIQRQSEERHEQHVSSRINRSEGSRTVRQSSQSSTVRRSSQTQIDNSDIHNEVNLVMQRLQMMQENAGTPIDTSHLDYEEMLMIQKALADNPSPPESPVDFETSDANAGEIILVSDDESNNNQTEGDSTGLKTTEVTSSLSSSHAPQAEELNYVAESFADTSSQSENTVVKLSSTALGSAVQGPNSDFLSARQTVITHTCVTEETPEIEETHSKSQITDVSESLTTFEDIAVKADAETSSESRNNIVETESSASVASKANVIEARTPRYQRLPSESGESRLPLPTMDWSPLERSNSPLSPNRFSFEDKKSENTGNVSSTSDGVMSSKYTVPKNLFSTPQSDARSPVLSELTIEIPSDSSATSQNWGNGTSPSQDSANQNDMIKSDTSAKSTPPLVKSRGASLSSSETPSPAGSETVTTVFEEFVQAVPLSILRQFTGSDDDE